METPADARSLVAKYYRLVDAEDFEEMLKLFAPDIVYERYGHPTIAGADALRAFYLGDRQIAGGRHSIDVIVADGEWVAAKGSFAGRLKDGTTVDVGFADFHQFRSGLIRRRYTFFAGRAI